MTPRTRHLLPSLGLLAFGVFLGPAVQAQAAPQGAASSSKVGSSGAEAPSSAGETDSGASASGATDSAVSREAAPTRSSTRARVEYQKANAAFRAGHYVDARHHFRLALDADPTFDVLCNLGRTEAMLADNAKAYEHLTGCVAIYPTDPALSGSLKKFEGLRSEVRARLSQEQIELAEARAKKYEELTREPLVEPTPADEIADEPEPPAEPASSQASSEPTQDSSMSWKLPVSAGLGVVGLAGLGVGIGFFAKAGAVGSDADALQSELGDDGCPAGNSSAQCATLTQKLQESDDAHLVGVVGVAAGSAFIAGAVLTYLLWPEPSSVAAGLSLRPELAWDPLSGLYSAGVSGSF